MKYLNPILKGFHPDPSICFDGESYYLIVSSFEFFPALPIYKSTDLLNWQRVNAVIKKEGLLDLNTIKNSEGLLAPTIRYHNGWYFVVCTNTSQGNFISYTKDPEDEWSEPIWIDCPLGLDPSLTFIDGKCYYQLKRINNGKNGNAIIQFEINPFSGEVLSEIKVISTGCGGRDTEAPHILKKDGWYYLFLAEGGTREGHMVTVQRSKNIWGPFDPCPYNPVLTNRNVKLPLQAVGHSDFFQDKKGNWWLVALATRPIKQKTLLGRETILLPVEWSGDWPIVNETGVATLEVETHRIKGVVDVPCNYFTLENLISISTEIDYVMKDDKLVIKNSPNYLGIPKAGPVSYLSVSQKDYNFTFSTEINVKKLDLGEFGLAVYKGDLHQARFGVKKNPNNHILFVDKIHFDFHEIIEKSNEDKHLILILKGNQKEYNFLIKDQNEKILLEERMATIHFTNEATYSPFTGVQLGAFSKAKAGYTTFENIILTYY